MTAALKIHRTTDDVSAAAQPQPTTSSPGWVARLVSLLSRLEDRRARLPDKVRGNAASILETVEQMVAECEVAASVEVFPAELNTLQAEALAKAGAFLMAVNDTRQPAPVGVFRSLWASVTRSDDTAAPQVRACLLAATEAISAYFTLFTRTFPSSAAARTWVEAASTFLAEMNTQVKDLAD
jgi:hypothetical protein